MLSAGAKLGSGAEVGAVTSLPFLPPPESGYWDMAQGSGTEGEYGREYPSWAVCVWGQQAALGRGSSCLLSGVARPSVHTHCRARPHTLCWAWILYYLKPHQAVSFWREVWEEDDIPKVRAPHSLQGVFPTFL